MATTAYRQFWQDPAFEEFLPWIKVQPAHDTPAGRNRLEVSPQIPSAVLAKALAFKGSCARCGNSIHVFRSRAAESQRGFTGNIYLAACCPLSVRIGCSRGSKASEAYEVIASLARNAQHNAEQGGLL